jgi:hypothetical protein
MQFVGRCSSLCLPALLSAAIAKVDAIESLSQIIVLGIWFVMTLNVLTQGLSIKT